MAKLTKTSFAAAQRRLGIKKVSKKNIGRIAKEARRGGKSKSRTIKSKTTKTTKSNPKSKGRRMGKNTQQTIWKLARVLAGVGPFVEPAFHQEWSTKTKIGVAGARLTGYRFDLGKWEANRLIEGYGPLTVTVIAQKASSFVRGLIRRL